MQTRHHHASEAHSNNDYISPSTFLFFNTIALNEPTCFLMAALAIPA